MLRWRNGSAGGFAWQSAGLCPILLATPSLARPRLRLRPPPVSTCYGRFLQGLLTQAPQLGFAASPLARWGEVSLV